MKKMSESCQPLGSQEKTVIVRQLNKTKQKHKEKKKAEKCQSKKKIFVYKNYKSSLEVGKLPEMWSVTWKKMPRIFFNLKKVDIFKLRLCCKISVLGETEVVDLI